MLRAAVIGLGQIGQGYDYTSPDDTVVLTHASAFHYHPAYDLVAGVDTDPEQRARFEAKYGKPAYAGHQAMMEEVRPQVVALAMPTPLHAAVFNEVLAYRPLAILCEKPIAQNLEQAKQMLARAEQNQCALVVNYMRRFEPGVLQLRELIASGAFGTIYKGVVWYSKGLLNNGSHFIDLLNFIFGSLPRTTVLAQGRKWKGIDPEPDVRLEYPEASVYLLAGREECYTLAEMELYGTEGRLGYKREGELIEYQQRIADPLYPGYTILDSEKASIGSELKRALWHTVEHLRAHLEEKAPLNSNGETAVETLQVVEQINKAL